MGEPRRAERGQVLPLLAAVVLLAALLMLALVQIGTVAIGRGRAQAAADAVALAGAVHGRAAADRVAAADQVTVVAFVMDGADVQVEVVTEGTGPGGGQRARARARRTDGGVLPVAPAMRAVLARAGQVIGHRLAVLETDDDGLGVRIGPADAARLPSVASETGLCLVTPGPPDRFEVCPPPPAPT